MRIAELEAHHEQYTAFEERIVAMVGARDVVGAISLSEACLQHIVPEIQYRKKRDVPADTPLARCIDVICWYAPPLFVHSALESLHSFVSSERVLARHEKDYLGRAEAAITKEDAARRLWTRLDQQSGASRAQPPPASSETPAVEAEILQVWEELGIVGGRHEDGVDAPYLKTRLAAETSGICQNCGIRVKGRRDAFFQRAVCRNCRTEGYFFIEYARVQ